MQRKCRLRSINPDPLGQFAPNELLLNRKHGMIRGQEGDDKGMRGER